MEKYYKFQKGIIITLMVIIGICLLFLLSGFPGWGSISNEKPETSIIPDTFHEVIPEKYQSETDTPQNQQAEQENEVLDENPEFQSIKVYSIGGKRIRTIKYTTEPGWEKFANYIKGYPDYHDTISGDFDGDGIMEKAWFKNNDAFLDDCRENQSTKSCRGIIVFSNKSINPLVIDNCPLGCFINEGDLNGDKKDEIGVLPGWFAGGCKLYHVYEFKNNYWGRLCEPINSAMNLREAGIDVIQKHPRDSGYVIIRESALFIESKFPGFDFKEENVGPFSCAGTPLIEYKLKLKN